MELVFVCSGNTCRSPLALCAWRLAVREISARGGSKRGATFRLGQIKATSAGLCAREGAGAAPHAQKIVRDWGEDLSQHQATLFRPEHAKAELIVAMTSDQASVVRAHFSVRPGQVQLLGEYAPRRARFAETALLSPSWASEITSEIEAYSPADPETEADILDPFGGSMEAYEACAMRIRRSVFELAYLVSNLK